MRLIETQTEARLILNVLPAGLHVLKPAWDAVEAACLGLRADLFYTDVVLAHNLQFLPKILRGLEESTCFIFNHASLLRGAMIDGSDVALEITSEDNPSNIRYELSNAGRIHHCYLSVFYFVGDFGVVSASGDWLVFARTDDRAIFTANNAAQYLEFNRCWWNSVGSARPDPL